MRQVRFHQVGGPEVLQVDEVGEPAPGAGELLVDVDLIGVSLAAVRHVHAGKDVALPGAPSGEVVGRVVDVGEGVAGWSAGQRVAGVVFGAAYAERVVVPAALAAAIPDTVDDRRRSPWSAAGRSRSARRGRRPWGRPIGCWVTAALSGVGQLAVQIPRLLGARATVGAVSSQDKADFAVQQLGVEVVTYDTIGAPEVVDTVDAVLDGVGGEVGSRCLATLAEGGRLVAYSAMPTMVDTNVLRMHAQRVIGFNMAHLVRRGDGAYRRQQEELLGWAIRGELRAVSHRVRFPLERAGEAHAVVLDRANVGKVLIDPRC